MGSQKAASDRLFRQFRDDDRPAANVMRARAYLSRFPDDWPVWCRLGEVLGLLGRYDEAAMAFARAMRLSKHVRPHARRFLFVFIGSTWKQRGAYAQAARWYRRSIAAAPDDAGGYVYLGGIYARQGQLARAQRTYLRGTRCTEGAPDEAWLNLGLMYRSQERFDRAAACFRKALTIDPDYRSAKVALADVTRAARIWRRLHAHR